MTQIIQLFFKADYIEKLVERHFNPGLFNPKLQPQTFQPQTFQP